MRDTLFSVLAPPFCSHCHRPLEVQGHLCVSCKSLVGPVTRSKVGTLDVYALGGNGSPATSLLGQSFDASVYLGNLVAEYITFDIDCVVPIPAYHDEQKQGYIQTKVIAQQVSACKGICLVECIERVSPEPISGIRISERMRLLESSFRVRPSISEVMGKRVLVLDTISQSGSTLAIVAQKIACVRPFSLQAFVVSQKGFAAEKGIMFCGK